jgi:lipopolysaccharide assembly outer membrane protein LptD (OstA)
LILICGFAFCVLNFVLFCYSQENKQQPLIVNGDVVEYSTDQKEITATGHVEIIYKGATLTCQKITVNTQSKEAVAEGNPRLDDQKGVIEGTMIIYNFETKAGTIIDSKFRANPYFGKAKQLEKVSDIEYVAKDGYATTCSFNKPHYRIGAKEINIFPNDKIQTKGDVIYVADTPLLYLPQYNHSLKDNLMHVRVLPGSRKGWGPFFLTASRYNLTDNVNGRLYLDYRVKLGFAEGFGLNYSSKNFGNGDYKFYYTDERPDNIPAGFPDEFKRYFMRWRHKWDIDSQTHFISELYKITDERRKLFDPQANFLKDYFYREFERDSQPLTYALLHHNFQNAVIDFLVQKRVNHWFDQLDKLPVIEYTLPISRIGETPLYFENISSFATFNKKATTAPVTPDEVSSTRLDTTNKFSLPVRLAFLRVSPFVSHRDTFYDKGQDGASLPVRTIFYSGIDVSTKFYRIFDTKSNFLGMGINGLRHIITPSISYSYNHEPTIPSTDLKQIDSIDSIKASNVANLELSNKLQTKRRGVTVDLVDFLVNTSYIFKPKAESKNGSSFSDFIFKLKLLPFSWLRLESDATYKHSGSRTDEGYNRIINANYDLVFDFGIERFIGVGQRYQRKGGNEVTYNLVWRLNPKWKFSTFHRYNLGHDPTLTNGWREQQYGFERDLHCWTTGLYLNTKRNEGTTLWVIFRLKAFPEMEFGFDQTYHSPKSGTQSNP